jgi:hypothetical protein
MRQNVMLLAIASFALVASANPYKTARPGQQTKPGYRFHDVVAAATKHAHSHNRRGEYDAVYARDLDGIEARDLDGLEARDLELELDARDLELEARDPFLKGLEKKVKNGVHKVEKGLKKVNWKKVGHNVETGVKIGAKVAAVAGILKREEEQLEARDLDVLMVRDLVLEPRDFNLEARDPLWKELKQKVKSGAQKVANGVHQVSHGLGSGLKFGGKVANVLPSGGKLGMVKTGLKMGAKVGGALEHMKRDVEDFEGPQLAARGEDAEMMLEARDELEAEYY